MNKPLYNQSGFILPVLILLVVVIVVIARYFYLKNPETVQYQFVKQIEEKINVKPKVDPVGIPAEVAITKGGFIPSTVKIIPGQQVTFVNEDKNAHRVVPYPLAMRNSLPELDSEDLQPTDSFTYSFEKPGTFTISESLNPGKYTVTVVVN